ncbi:MAG: hypothetical protein Q8Q46_01685 [Candidatus Giovannonibacteria bacterium]|nr:hypothetical protein [Candidatus Giovannonibacteria bacterium]
MNKPKLIISSAYAAIITIVFVVVITILAELFAPLKDWLKNFSGHHWASKSIFSALIYAVATALLYWAFYSPNKDRLKKALIFLLVSWALGTVFLTAFYTGHHFNFF